MSIAMLVGRIAYIVQVQSFATNVARSVFSCMRDQTYVGVGNYILYWRDLANTTERSIRGGSAAFCQTVSTNDYSVAFLKKNFTVHCCSKWFEQLSSRIFDRPARGRWVN